MLTPMQSALDLRPARRRALGVLLGVLGSALAHALIYAALNWKVTLPPIDFELKIPSHVEFEMPGPTPPTQPPVTPANPEPSEQAQPPASEPALAAATAPAKPRIKRPKAAADAGVGDERPHERHPDAPSAPGEPALAAFAPAGAQIALRVNMARIRDSELAPDVRTLLEAVPDWRLILGGSGIDPLRDLERLYLASPDLKRSSVIIAGEYAG